MQQTGRSHAKSLGSTTILTPHSSFPGRCELKIRVFWSGWIYVSSAVLQFPVPRVPAGPTWTIPMSVLVEYPNKQHPVFCQTMKSTTVFVLVTESFRLKLEPQPQALGPPISKQLLQDCNSIFSPDVEVPLCALITLLAEPESINISLLTPPMAKEITGLAKVDKAHVWSSIARANVSSSPA